ncbi:MAG: sensor histidine kinase [Oscillatoriaceae cyanobacterium Prado104]|jgi:signal transduction histidine kinase|nr:sensor histidine kinase [Oscillatoriaceae cyanobacterium Prado104]
MQFRSTFIPDRSFRPILYLEWILLGITLLGEIRPAFVEISTTTRLLTMFALVAFGLMGLKLPAGNTRNKVLYTGLQFGLLFLAFYLQSRPSFFPLLAMVVVIRSCLLFEQIGRLTVAGIVFFVFLLIQFSDWRLPPPLRAESIPEPVNSTILILKFNITVTFGLTLLFILLLVSALLSERQSREKLLLANHQLREYALRIEDQAMLQERNRIAREIHDSLGHALTAQSIQLENALLFLPPDAEKTMSFVREAKLLGAKALQEVRRSISALRSNPLQGQSLAGAIAKTVAEFQNRTGILPDCNLEIYGPLPAEITTALYRIVQESLTNIYKHSGATQVRLKLQQSREAIHLEIVDNGQGFDPNQNTTGFGLQGMRERTAALGGQFSLTSQLQKGCRIMVSIGLPRLAL